MSPILSSYAEKSAKELGCQLLNKPHVRNAIFEANRRTISGRIATKAVHVLEQAIECETLSMRVRAEAAKTILDRAGFVMAVVAADTNPLAGKSLSELTRDELLAVVTHAKEVMNLAEQHDRERAAEAHKPIPSQLN